jgi:hypothetical protein
MPGLASPWNHTYPSGLHQLSLVKEDSPNHDSSLPEHLFVPYVADPCLMTVWGLREGEAVSYSFSHLGAQNGKTQDFFH